MLDKSAYYHGAAIVRLIDDERCRSIRKRGHLGYIVNDRTFLFLKYTTGARSPWGFTFDQEDVDRCAKMAEEYDDLYIGLICGGDGICALYWHEVIILLGTTAGHISARRKHNHSYSLRGTEGTLTRKVPQNRWPSLLFENAPSKSHNGNAEYVGTTAN